MLFSVIYKPRAGATEESQNRSLKLLANWTPPQGLEFKAHYFRADNGGIAVVEVDSAATILEGVVPFNPFLDFEVSPIVPVEEAVPIAMRVQAWRDSIK